MDGKNVLNICVVGVLLAVSATPLAAAFVDQCGSMMDGEMAASAPDRCAGLWGSCCDFGPPSSRTTGDAFRNARTTSTHADVLPTAIAPLAPLAVSAGPDAQDGRPSRPHRSIPLARLTVLRI